MRLSPVPDMSLRNIYDLKPEMLLDRGISLLLLDLDNTLIPYSQSLPPEEVCLWIKSFKDKGIEVFLVSNNRTDRAGIFSAAAGIPFVNRAAKPSKKKLLEAMEIMNKAPEDTAMLGDQVYTDVLAANSAGVTSIVVTPIDVHKPNFAVRYFFELPFRAMCKEKMTR